MKNSHRVLLAVLFSFGVTVLALPTPPAHATVLTPISPPGLVCSLQMAQINPGIAAQQFYYCTAAQERACIAQFGRISIRDYDSDGDLELVYYSGCVQYFDFERGQTLVICQWGVMFNYIAPADPRHKVVRGNV